MAHIHTAKIEDPDFAETYTACIQQNGDGWIGWIRDVPEVKCEERTREDLLKNPRIRAPQNLDRRVGSMEYAV